MEKDLGQSPAHCAKVVLFGPESTGKTTLAKKLAAHFNTKWVPEFARAYLQKKWDEKQEICTKDDLPLIAAGQMKLENEKAAQANAILFCDTDLLVTTTYSEVYFDGYCDPQLRAFALKNNYDLYLLTNIDIPWVADDLRDKPNERVQMLNRFTSTLNKLQRPYAVVQGQGEERFRSALQAIEQYLPYV